MPVEIADWNDLDNVRNDLSGDYVLVNDLDENTDGYAGIGDDWNPIGEREFDGDFYEGIFDGDGFEIRDLIVDDDDRSAALFSGNRGPINDLSVKAEISTTSNDFNAAILTGEARGDLSNCAVHGSVFAPDLVEVAGLAGRCDDAAIISDSYSTASVEGDRSVGGLVGRNEATVTDSYATGSVEGDTDFGGLVGRNEGTVTDSYWDTESTGQDSSDGDATGLTTAEMQGSEAETNMDGFDFTDVWDLVVEQETPEIDGLVPEEDGYPILLSVDLENQLNAQNISLVEAFALSVETNPATDISEFSATLNGELVELDDEADDADVFFEFGENVGDSQTPIQTLTGPETFDELIDEFEPNTTFEFRAVAEAQDADDETFIDEGDILTFDTEIVTLDGTISLDEAGVENADVLVYNFTQDVFEDRLSTDSDGNYAVDLPDADRLDTVAVAVDFDDGTERYGRVVTTVLE